MTQHVGSSLAPEYAGAEQTERLRSVATSLCQTYRTAEELVAAFVREAITQGIYRPGEHLPQDAIANLLGISRVPVRAGLRQLEDEGLVANPPHRGAMVTALRPEQIGEIYELRAVLECYLLDQCMPRLSPDRLSQLRASVALLEKAEGGRETVDYRMAFYDQLYSLAYRPRALKVVKRLRGEVDRYLLGWRVVDEPLGHLGLLDRLEQGDLAGAKAWLRRHLEQVSARLQAVVADAERDLASPLLVGTAKKRTGR
ncbi:MAG: GntR family transcriptional regulator [Acidimicrobiales bacterium]